MALASDFQLYAQRANAPAAAKAAQDKAAAQAALDTQVSQLLGGKTAPMLGRADNPEYPTQNYYGAPSSSKPMAVVDGKIFYPDFSMKVYAGNDRRESFIQYDWANKDWIQQQVAAGKISQYTYTDPTTGKKYTGMLIDPSLLSDPSKFETTKVSTYRNNADLNGNSLLSAAVMIGGAFLVGPLASAIGSTLGTGAVVSGALAGGAIGAGSAALTGGDIGKGALLGAVGGAINNGALTGVQNSVGTLVGSASPLGNGAVLVTNQGLQSFVDMGVAGVANAGARTLINGGSLLDFSKGALTSLAASAVTAGVTSATGSNILGQVAGSAAGTAVGTALNQPPDSGQIANSTGMHSTGSGGLNVDGNGFINLHLSDKPLALQRNKFQTQDLSQYGM